MHASEQKPYRRELVGDRIKTSRRWLVPAVLLVMAGIAVTAAAQEKPDDDEDHEWLYGRWGVGSAAACGTNYYLFGGLIVETVTALKTRREIDRYTDVRFQNGKDGKLHYAYNGPPEPGGDSTFTIVRKGKDTVVLQRPSILNGKESRDEITLVRCATSPRGWIYGRWGMRMGQLDTCGDCGDGDHISHYDFEGGQASHSAGRGSRYCSTVAWSDARYSSVDEKGAEIDLGEKTLVVRRTSKPNEVTIHTKGKKNDQATYYRCKRYDTE